MKTYKDYRIMYNGKLLEVISATSKKSVNEYIRDTYKTKDNFLIGLETCYKLTKFKVELY